MEYTKIKYECNDGIAMIRMNYKKNLNAVDEIMAQELLAAMKQTNEDFSVKIVILSSTAKAFSAGGDIGYFYKQVKSGSGVDLTSLCKAVEELADYMKRMDKIIITAVNGAAAGAGVGLALGGDYVFCAKNAVFLLAFANVGLIPDSGTTYLLSKCIGPWRAMDIACSGRPVSVQEAADLGIVKRITEPENLETEALEFARKLVQGPLVSYKNIKKQIYYACYKDYKNWLDTVERPLQQECAKTEDFAEGSSSFMEKREPSFKGK